MFQKKQPSPEVNPANQKGFGIFGVCTRSLPFGFISGNACCNFLDNPYPARGGSWMLLLLQFFLILPKLNVPYVVSR